MVYREKYGTLFLKKRKKLCLDIGLQKLIIPSELGGFGCNSFSRTSNTRHIDGDRQGRYCCKCFTKNSKHPDILQERYLIEDGKIRRL